MTNIKRDYFYTLETNILKHHLDFYYLFDILLKHNKNFHVDQYYNIGQFLIFNPHNPSSKDIDKRHMLFGVNGKNKITDIFLTKSEFLKVVLIHIK